MRILYHHRTRATDAQRVHILEMVRAFRACGHAVEVASWVDTEGSRPEAGEQAREASWKRAVVRIPFAHEAMQLGYNFLSLPWLLWKILRGRADFVYERYSLFTFCGVLAARLARIPIVLEVNSPFALEMHRENEIRTVRFAAWMERVVCNAATEVVAVSGPLRRILIENGVREAKIVVMPNGVNLERLRPARDSAALRAQLGLSGKVVIGFAGWFRRWHGLEFLVETFASAGLGRLGAALLLVGDGPSMPALNDIVAQHNLSGAVIFSGAVPHEDVAAYLDLIDIAVQPAANEYCCPMKVIEYMGLGKPVVAPRQENIVELLTDRHDALLFTPGDAASLAAALTTLIREPQTRRALGRRAYESIGRRGLLWTENAQRAVKLLFHAPGI